MEDEHFNRHSTAEMLLRAGQVREKIITLIDDVEDVETSKHNSIWYLGDEKSHEELWKIRGIIMKISDNLEDMLYILKGDS